jgi:hypothetical protein
MSEKAGGQTYRRKLAHNTFSSTLGASDQHSGGMAFEEEAVIIFIIMIAISAIQ